MMMILQYILNTFCFVAQLSSLDSSKDIFKTLIDSYLLIDSIDLVTNTHLFILYFLHAKRCYRAERKKQLVKEKKDAQSEIEDEVRKSIIN